MQIITKNENKILLLIKNNLTKYPESISYDTIREILDMSETEVVDLLKSLEDKKFVYVDSSDKIVTYNDLNQEVKTVEDKSALKKYMLNKTEEDAYEIIKQLIEKYEGYAPCYIVEGELLYGDLKLSPKKTYNNIVSLENQDLIKKIKRVDGEYYTI
ncbi:hypothetical protein [Methanosphaera cuniculi]|uniref:Uncharacterized protein n=1 Tax=Methanosphaera cuniculi TaxID=1077256 RepID=A0A2A2HC90_9EURY|nr:hypothetical protein [Methanosphaera cuniculi]PAV07042.1 hypothetical protein ASJ82_02085 [Methanosphaera cuniculi]PWL07554.1 hypothetical protein MSCUN_15290 [Methanosphaera cuniculi]